MSNTSLKNRVALAIALASTIGFAQQAASQAAAPAATAAPKPAAPKLTRADLDILLFSPEQLLIIDLRRPDELATIGGFPVYLNIQAAELEKRLASIPKDRTIVTVSNHSGRSGAAANLLLSKGFKVAGAIGAQDYESQGGKLTKIATPPPSISFFVTSVGLGKGADLGGLEGADKHCQALATAASPGNGRKTWRAYLSTQAANGKPAINARDRIGQGPWYNARGALIARDVIHLHGDTIDLARLGNNLSRNSVFTEKNEPVKGAGDKPNEHDILTGSQADGRAFADSEDRTCKNYTSSAADGSARVGHFDRTGGGNTSWNSAHDSKGCGQENLVATGGAGLFYCFATN